MAAVQNHVDVKTVHYKDARRMDETPTSSVHCIVTSPPYFTVKDYARAGYQIKRHSARSAFQIGDVASFDAYIDNLLTVWHECQRVLAPNGKLVINTPLMPMPKREYNTHHNRHIFDLNSEIQHSMLRNTDLHLLDVYVWNRTNPSKRLMFGSYPHPRNFYAQNTIEFIAVYVKDGKPINGLPADVKEWSRLSQQEWVEYTKQVWNIPIPGRGDSALGKHPPMVTGKRYGEQPDLTDRYE